ncbi:hypothetical protein ACTA71_001895 [Dictyostelium dimigraforme]
MFKFSFNNLTKHSIQNPSTTLNNNGIKLFSFGSGWSGQLGLGNNIFEQLTPKQIEFNGNVTLSENDKIKTGSYHALLVKENSIHVWGQNNFGQLGIGNFIDHFKPIENKLILPILNREQQQQQQQQKQQKHIIENVECGSFHTIISTNENKTYSFGWNSRIQCGHIPSKDGIITEKINQPKEIEILRDKKVNSISCGFDFSIISTVDDGVYIFGMNDRGQCNGEELANSPIFKEINNNNNNIINPIENKVLNGIKIKKLSSGWGHTLLLTTDGELLSWGSNQHGQCGTGIKTKISPITKIKIPNNLKVLDISCGSCVSSAILSDNNVYIWGSSGDGKLGLGPNQKDDLLNPTLLKTLINNENNNNSNNSNHNNNNNNNNNNIYNNGGMRNISFGSDHCVSLPINKEESGIFYGWGFGQHGCLGFGDSIDQLKVYSIPEKNDFFKNNNLEILKMKSSIDTTFSLVSSIK